MDKILVNVLERRIEKLEKHLSVLSAERIEQLDAKLETFGHSLNKRMTSLEVEVKNKSESANIQLDLQRLAIEVQNEKDCIRPIVVVSRRQERLKRIKEKTNKFLSTISVHGISRIVKADNFIVKLVWTIMILISVTAGLYIIAKSIKDYYNYDVITNIKRMTPSYVTYPAITICFYNEFTKIYYINGLPFKSEISHNISIQNFLEFGLFKNKELNTSELDFFQNTNGLNSCVRFNGNRDNKARLEIVNNTSERLDFKFSTIISKIVSRNEQVKYKLSYDYFDLYIGDNYLNSYMNFIPLSLMTKHIHSFHIVKSETEKKLGKPYNDCDESLNKTYRQMNCIEQCINRNIKDEYNCSIPSYYKIEGLGECHNQTKILIKEFYKTCEYECPKECESYQFRVEVLSSSSNELDLYFYFSDLSYLEITQIPKINEYSLIASIGGSLGLFVGIRFLSLVEVVEYIIDLIYVIFIERSHQI